MTFAPQGYRLAAVPAAAGVLAGLVFGWTYGLPILVLALAVLLFFRDPERTVPEEPQAVIAPADGRVCAVETGTDGHWFDRTASTKISIFMSPLDVHINRIPVAGTVERIEHRAGQFAAAYSPKASEINESNSLLIRARDGYELVVVQIAGWLARRIVCYIGEKASVARGERFGLIMFGSRVDVFLPPRARVLVSTGQRAVAGRTVIAEMPPE